jgi:hypothetical protein
MDNFLRTVTLSEVDIGDLLEAIEARLKLDWIHSSEEEDMQAHARNLLSLRKRLENVLDGK